MKRLYMIPALLACGFFSLFSVPMTRDDCVIDNSPGQIGSISPNYVNRYGAWVKMIAKVGGDCASYVTDNPTWTLTADTNEAQSGFVEGDSGAPFHIPIRAKATTSASISNFSVTSSVNEYFSKRANTAASSEVMDLVMIENPGQSATDIEYIPVSFCSTFTSSATGLVHSTISSVGYGYHWVGLEPPGRDTLEIPNGLTIEHTATGEVRNNGHIKMTGKHVYFWIRLRTHTQGKADIDVVDIGGGNTHNTPTREGSVTVSFTIGALPSGATCYSASGTFPGCERLLLDPPICMADASGGNPINFALGSKYQRESDYSGGLLSFSRLYRSDAGTETGVMGENWRHNFDCNANIIITPESTTVDVTNRGGATTVFRKDTSTGVWKATDNDTVSTFADVFDPSSNHIGYRHTTSSDIREYQVRFLMAMMRITI